MIRIVNRKTHRGASVYVGRPSVLGNPFVLGTDGDRATVIARYRRWLWNEIEHGDGRVLAELRRLAALTRAGDLTLSCWCSPQDCHGDVLRAAIEWYNDGKQLSAKEQQ